MHQRLIVLLDAYKWQKPEEHDSRKNKRIPLYTTSKKARVAAFNGLISGGFATRERFCGGPADWLVIGGRWSGDFTLYKLNPLLVSSCWEKLREEGAQGFPEKTQKIFKEFFPNFKGLKPFYRDNQYHEFGAEDDAQIVDDKLWKRLIRHLIKKSGDDYFKDPLIYLDGSVDDLNKKTVVGKMWAVVVDYHS